MNTIDKLNREFLTQNFSEGQPYSEKLDKYKQIACHYAQMENAIAVLSDWRTDTSYIYYGEFSRHLGIDPTELPSEVKSIWEEVIFQLIHPDDLAEKHLQELCFFHFIKQQPKKRRTDYYLASKLHLKSSSGSYVSVLHRVFYVPDPACNTLWLALCLYNPLAIEMPAKSLIINSITGDVTELEKQNNAGILTEREKQTLRLIDKGLPSKEIAQTLSISIHTVSRHRQEILGKLQVKNSIEACRIAKELKLI